MQLGLESGRDGRFGSRTHQRTAIRSRGASSRTASKTAVFFPPNLTVGNAGRAAVGHCAFGKLFLGVELNAGVHSEGAELEKCRCKRSRRYVSAIG